MTQGRQRGGKRKRDATSHHRLDKMRARVEGAPPDPTERGEGEVERNAWIDCGWGRLFFAQTFERLEAMVEELKREQPEKRDIAFYLRDPHVALALAPQDLFLDPSHTYRLDLNTYQPGRRGAPGYHIRRVASRRDGEEINPLYATRHMVPVDPGFFWEKRDSRRLTVFVVEDDETGEILGAVMGVNHARAFGDPERGSSLWCLAVDPQAPYPGIGEALVRRLAEHFQARGCNYMDLSVLHDNEEAIRLYEKLGFKRVPFFALKTRNAINEKLFAGPSFDAKLNPYALIIVNEARRRGIHVEVLDSEAAYFRLTFGGRSVVCRESLSELTTAVAMSRCQDKRVTRRLLGAAGLKVPAQQMASSKARNEAFLADHGSVVVKPANGEQGRGVAVGLKDSRAVEAAVRAARKMDPQVVLEQCASGEDLRLIVIDFKVVAGAVRRPPLVVGDGKNSIRKLIERQSRRRKAATGGEAAIPIDEETKRAVAEAGYELDDLPSAEESVIVRHTANLHTGGTIHDVTDRLHPTLCDAAVRAARAIDIPVVGIDMIVPSPREAEYVIIEANERPGLANHEPQPTAERFIDLLFPYSIPTEVRTQQDVGTGP